MSRRAVFLDRDGTLNVKAPDHQYISDPENLVLIPGAAEGAALLARAGFVLAVVSNQRGIARGMVEGEVLEAIEVRIQGAMASLGAEIAAFRYCPHEMDAGCRCRKPSPGMILDLAGELDLDLAESWMVGDSPSDVEAGRAAGCRTALVGAGGASADVVAPSLQLCAARIAALST